MTEMQIEAPERLSDTERALIEALDKAVDLYGEDYIYEEATCVYVNDAGEKSCLVGHAMIDVFPELRSRLKGTIASARTAFEYFIPEVQSAVARAFQAAQDVQDGRRPWGEAREVFHQVLRKEGLEPVS